MHSVQTRAGAKEAAPLPCPHLSWPDYRSLELHYACMWKSSPVQQMNALYRKSSRNANQPSKHASLPVVGQGCYFDLVLI